MCVYVCICNNSMRQHPARAVCTTCWFHFIYTQTILQLVMQISIE